MDKDYEAVKRDNKKLQEENSTLLNRLSDFEDLNRLVALQKKVLVRFRREIECSYQLQLENVRRMIVNDARERNRDLSYIVADTSEDNFGKIMVVTPEFEKKFYFSNEEVIGSDYVRVLKNSDNIDYSPAIKELFDSLGKEKIDAVIADGKRGDRVIRLVKHKPYIIKVTAPDKDGNLIEYKNSFTRVDVHDVGFLQKRVNGIFRKVYHSRKPRTLQESAEQLHIKQILLENEEMGDYFKELVEKGMGANTISRLWGKYRGDVKRFRNECAKKVLDIQRRQKKE